MSNTSNFTKYDFMNTSHYLEGWLSDSLLPDEYREKRTELRHHQFKPFLEYLQEQVELKWKSENSIKEELQIGMDELLSDFDFSMFKILFLALDVLLIIYRFSHMYVNARYLCIGFEENVYLKDMQSYLMAAEMEVDKSYEVQISAQASLGGTTSTVNDTDSQHNSIRAENNYSTVDRLKKQPHHPPHRGKQPNGNIPTNPAHNAALLGPGGGGGGPGEYLLQKNNSRVKLKSERSCSMRLGSTWEYYTSKLIHTCLVSKLVVIAVMLVLMYITLLAVSELYNTSLSDYLMLSLTTIFPAFSKVKVHVDFSNWYLDVQAEEVSQSLEVFYRGLGNFVLEELQGLVQYFNSGMYISVFINYNLFIFNTLN